MVPWTSSRASPGDWCTGREFIRQVAAVELEPRSAYVLSGAARFSWQHSIPATKALRWSITFRTLKEPGGR